MSIPLIVDGSSYQYPSQGDKSNTGWGNQTTSWASAVTSALTRLGLGGTTSPLPNAVIDIDSTSKGILIPRMTTTQRNAISSPPNSLLIFNITDKVLQYYDLSVTQWISVGARLPDNAIFSGTLTVNGNITGLGSISVSAGVNGATGNFTDETDATNADTAPLKTLGGMAVKKKLFVGTDLGVGGILSVTGVTNLTGDANIAGQLNSNGTFNLLPAGTIIIVSSLVVPSGFLPCNGAQNISRTTQSRLFAAMPSTTSAITVTVASTINWTAHGLSTGHSIQFTTTGTLPTGLTANTIYFVRVLTANTFALYGTLSQAMNVSVTTGQVTFTVTGSGTHTGLVYYYGNGIDSTNTTFGVPDFRGAVPRGIGTSNGYITPATVNLGEKTDDQIQNITGSVAQLTGGSGSSSGALSASNTGSAIITPGGAFNYFTVSFNASLSARTGTETRAKSLGVYYLIKT